MWRIPLASRSIFNDIISYDLLLIWQPDDHLRTEWYPIHIRHTYCTCIRGNHAVHLIPVLLIPRYPLSTVADSAEISKMDWALLSATSPNVCGELMAACSFGDLTRSSHLWGSKDSFGGVRFRSLDLLRNEGKTVFVFRRIIDILNLNPYLRHDHSYSIIVSTSCSIHETGNKHGESKTIAWNSYRSVQASLPFGLNH